MKARMLQIAARYLGYGLTVVLTKLGVEYSQGTIDSIVEPVMAGVGIMLSIVLDHYLHRLQKAAGDRGLIP